MSEARRWRVRIGKEVEAATAEGAAKAALGWLAEPSGASVRVAVEPLGGGSRQVVSLPLPAHIHRLPGHPERLANQQQVRDKLEPVVRQALRASGAVHDALNGKQALDSDTRETVRQLWVALPALHRALLRLLPEGT